MIFASLITADLEGGDMLTAVFQAVALALGVQAFMAVVSLVAARLRGIPRDYIRTLMMTTMYHNSGNYGVPLQRLTFAPLGYADLAVSLQVFIMVTQNITSFTIGIFLAAGGKGTDWRKNLRHVLRFPPIYVLAFSILAIVLRDHVLPGSTTAGIGRWLEPFWVAIRYIKEAFIAVALATLGAQLALVIRQKHSYPITTSVIIRLLLGPAAGLAMIYLLGIEGVVAQVLLIGSSTPTAVNCMLLCLQFDNHPDFAARSVFYSTILSPITVTLTIFLSLSGWLPGTEALVAG
jgi:predicted permease